ncbi:MAG: hypothetical protein HS123_04560 [Solibacteraceae bacterium]|nr:hypothetical protein [Solibacteraceae bacterium]
MASFEGGDGFLHLGLGFAVLGVIVPGHGVHDGRAVERGDIGIVGEVLIDLLHGCGVGLQPLLAVLSFGVGEADGDGVDQSLFGRGHSGFLGEGFAGGGVGGAFAFLFQAESLMFGPDGEGFAPVGHPEFGVVPGGFLEAALGFS